MLLAPSNPRLHDIQVFANAPLNVKLAIQKSSRYVDHINDPIQGKPVHHLKGVLPFRFFRRTRS